PVSPLSPFGPAGPSVPWAPVGPVGPGGPGGPCNPSATGSSCVSPRLHASRTATRPVDVLQSTAALAEADIATQATTAIHLHPIHSLLAAPRRLRDFPVALAPSITDTCGVHVWFLRAAGDETST